MGNRHDTTLYLGIDGGGSTCRARLAAADGRILGEGKGGPANLRLGIMTVMQEIRLAAESALSAAGLAHIPLDQLHAGIGLAGAVLESDVAAAAPIRSLFAECKLSQDAYIACLGAHQGRDGGILILGTGSCAQVIRGQESRTFGGWGFALSDQASGAWLGHAAVRLALQAEESIVPDSALTQAISLHFGQQPTAYLRWSLDAKPADYARFAPLVFAHAADQDPHALVLLETACAEVTRFLDVLQQYQTGRLALLGGLAHLYPPFLPEPIRRLLSSPQGDAQDGALLMAGLRRA